MKKKLKQLSSRVAKQLSLKTVNNHSTVQLFNHSTAKQFAFTLAEVLITITIIGVVAAMTIPNLLTDINQRKYNSMSGNFQRKLGEALRVMNGQNTLKGHTTTMSFVNELGKNFKTVKICSKVEECFPAKFKRSGGDEVTTSTLTDATSLGKNYNTETVGVEFVNGVRAIIAYNPEYKLQKNGDVVDFKKDNTNKTVRMNTDVMSIIFDVSEDDNNKIDEDIFAFNTNFGSSGTCEYTKIGDFCFKELASYSSLPCYEGINKDYCGTASGYGDDYWAGAQKACKDEEMRLPTLTELRRMWELGKDVNNAGIVPTTGNYWSSSEDNANAQTAYRCDFSNGSTARSYNKREKYGVLCIAN